MSQIPNKGGCGSGCGSKSTELPEKVSQRVAQHPCYSEGAHHRYARMHLAVAPACNIQCNYCNRKFDCANESRPGVVSELLTPEQAVNKAKQVAAAIPQLTVIGIAGPGDPLANPEKTLKTLAALHDEMPDVKLCISTNGLGLLEQIDTLIELGVDHLTITLNALTAETAAKIYPWVRWEGKAYRGEEGAKLLLERQFAALERLAQTDMLVKINSVLIPDINDKELPALSKKLREYGVFMHNIMPLIARPEHGTVFGLNGQREPDDYELMQVREACGADVKQMHHCQQCRSDAIGLLGEDRSQEFTNDQLTEGEFDYLSQLKKRTMIQASLASQGAAEEEDAKLIGVATKGGEAVDEHFGHARELHLYSVSDEGVFFVGRRRIPLYCESAEACDDGQEDKAARMTPLLEDLDALFCARIGREPWQWLESLGAVPVVDYAWQPIPVALKSWWQKQADTKAPVQKRDIA